MRVIKEWDQDGRHVQITVSEVGEYYLTIFHTLRNSTGIMPQRITYRIEPDDLQHYGIDSDFVWVTQVEPPAEIKAVPADVGFDVVCPQPDAPAGYYGCGVGGCHPCKTVSARE